MAGELYSITLAAGASSRMPDDMRPKACCRVGAVSVIEHALDTYEQAGITRHVIVIGVGADQIMDEVARRRRNVLFAWQGAPRGTGDAVQCALDLLDGIGPPDQVMISAGDKVIAPYVIRGLLQTYSDYACGLCLTAGVAADFPDSGRIIERDGKVAGIIEVPDIQVRLLAARLRGLPPAERPATAGDLLKITTAFFKNPAKLSKCFPALRPWLSAAPDQAIPWDALREAAESIPPTHHLGDVALTPEQALAAPLANVSVYAARFDLLKDAVARLRSDNVQGERYFTDVAEMLSRDGHDVRVFRIGHPEHVMAFNTLPELETIRKVYAERAEVKSRYPSLEQWDNALQEASGADLLRAAVQNLISRVGAKREAFLVRSPGRINLMGRHVDHQGGVCNLMAIDHEITMAAAPRDDDLINLWNTDSVNYPERSFTVRELTKDVVWEDWLRTLNTQFVQRVVSLSAGDWVNYVKGAVLRLQHRFRDRKLRGMDAYVAGNIPVAAGLSSSSALLVATAEAMIEMNALNVRLSEFVDLCGEGEWFVGTRGGSADHAAIKYGREWQVVSVSFFPFRILAQHPFPEDCSLIVCHSGQFAKKTENARERFNARVACYHMAREMIKQQFPELAPRIHHLRDVNARTLDLSLPAIYRILLALPNQITPQEAEAMAKEHPTVAKCLAGVDPSRNVFPLRDMALFGLAECERSARAGDLLDRKELERFGQMMRLSHDGDRVARWSPDHQPFNSSVSDEQVRSLIERASALAPLEQTGAALWQQPGAYDCSTPEIDLMVDTALACPGVLGAQLSGAGLGGCIMVLVRRDAASAVVDTLRARYYAPRNIEPRMFVCRPSQGSHVLTAVEQIR